MLTGAVSTVGLGLMMDGSGSSFSSCDVSKVLVSSWVQRRSAECENMKSSVSLRTPSDRATIASTTSMSPSAITDGKRVLSQRSADGRRWDTTYRVAVAPDRIYLTGRRRG